MGAILRNLYFISDLHIGGDEALGVCEFEDELIRFLDDLAEKPGEVELVIVGDAFGLWEFTQVDGAEKLDLLIGQFPRIFEAFRRVGAQIRITLLPGNHDYELACYPKFVDQLATFNVHLEQDAAVTRSLETRRIWIEHGSQHDRANRMPDYGNPYAQPIGYYITSNMVGWAGQRSELGRYNWLKDVQSVYPTEDIPRWAWSNYFYKEMNPFLRWILLPFLVLFGLTLFILGGAALSTMGIIETNVFLDNGLFQALGVLGSLVQLILTINAVVVGMVAVLAIPVYLLSRDLKRTASRFGLTLEPEELTGEKEDDYLDAATRVFEENPDVAVFVYGHTHTPSVRQVGERAVLNTGTWIKQLEPVAPRLGLLPSIYVPSYRLSYFRIHEANGEVVAEYDEIPKTPASELSWLQRLAARSTRRNENVVPSRTTIPPVDA